MIHRPVLLPVYLPALLLGVPAQASLVLLPLHVLTLGGSAAQAAAVVGAHGVGMMLMDIPAGIMAARWGDKAVMVLATVLIGLAYVGYALADAIAWFFAIALLNGTGSSAFLLGRLTYVSARVAPRQRGRVIAMIAGSLRVSALLGPLAGTALAVRAGYSTSFLIGAMFVLAAMVCLLAFARNVGQERRELRWSSVPRVFVEHRRVLAGAGTAAVIFMVLRAARGVLLPLLGVALKLDATTIGFIVSVSAAVDVLMFYPAGVLMDRYGRRATALPSAVLFTLVMAGFALVDNYQSLLLLGIAVGFTNGLSTGIVLTLGADLAPPAQREEFLGIWRLLSDCGTAAGPLVISSVVAVAPLGAAAMCISVIGAAGIWLVYRFVDETLER